MTSLKKDLYTERKNQSEKKIDQLTKDEIKNRIAELEKAGVNRLAIHAGTMGTLRAAMDDFADNVINY